MRRLEAPADADTADEGVHALVGGREVGLRAQPLEQGRAFLTWFDRRTGSASPGG
jgi:hypothetical protein